MKSGGRTSPTPYQKISGLPPPAHVRDQEFTPEASPSPALKRLGPHGHCPASASRRPERGREGRQPAGSGAPGGGRAGAGRGGTRRPRRGEARPKGPPAPSPAARLPVACCSSGKEGDPGPRLPLACRGVGGSGVAWRPLGGCGLCASRRLAPRLRGAPSLRRLASAERRR